MSVVNDEAILVLLRQAWLESQPGTSDAHEEGGFVVRNVDGSLDVERWPRGRQNTISVPPHPNGKRGDRVIVATFHTHPNPGLDFQQEPSLTDIRAVRSDPDLAHADFEGELVIANQLVYRIRKNGDVETLGDRKKLLTMS